MRRSRLALKNLLRRPGRTLALVLLTAFLALSVFGGSLVIQSLRRGLDSLEARLGADIIVLPAAAESKVSFQNLLLQGTAGAFYMDAATLERVREVEGVALAAPQTFLASLKADCCAIKVQVIGIDPETDFVVAPWIAQTLSQGLRAMEVAVGCKVTADVGEDLRIYDQNCRVVSRLAETGTGLDTAVYCDMQTMRVLLSAAEDKGITHKLESGDDAISAVYVKVEEDADIDAVNSRLNGHVRKATAVRMKSVLTGVSDGLSGIAHTITWLVGAIWALALVILMIAFGMMIRERRREFAVLRLLGVSRRGLCGLILREAGLCAFIGALVGVALAATAVFPFTTFIETRLGLPYLTPSAASALLLALVTGAVTVAAGMLSAIWASVRLSCVDPGTTLREGA